MNKNNSYNPDVLSCIAHLSNDEVKDFINICENIFENTKIILEKKWISFKEIFDKKNISRKECLLLPIRTIEKALDDQIK